MGAVIKFLIQPTLFLIIAVLFYQWFDTPVHEEFSYKTEEYILKYGYKYEKHFIESEDGFVSTLYRLLPAKLVQNRRGPPLVIFLGLLCTSDMLVTKGPGRDLVFFLADKGIDIWMGNHRGGRYNTPKNPETADTNFGFHEIGIYDISATIDYVLEMTKSPTVDLIGFSAGSSATLALLTTKPEYNQKIRKTLHMATGLGIKDTPFDFWLFYTLIETFPQFFLSTGILEIQSWRPHLAVYLCERSWLSSICQNIMKGFGYLDQNNSTSAAVLFSIIPSGTPYGVINHLTQLFRHGSEFRMRDYGEKRNFELYGRKDSPLYNLSQITAPQKLYLAEDDTVVPNDPIEKLFRQLSGYSGTYMVKAPFGHLGFVVDSATFSKDYVLDVINTLKSD